MRGIKKKMVKTVWNKMQESMYQNALITLSDGSVHIFTGKAFSSGKGEVRRITNVQFTIPKPLPFGYAFELVEDGKKR
jgi:hypothetical protein